MDIPQNLHHENHLVHRSLWRRHLVAFLKAQPPSRIKRGNVWQTYSVFRTCWASTQRSRGINAKSCTGCEISYQLQWIESPLVVESRIKSALSPSTYIYCTLSLSNFICFARKHKYWATNCCSCAFSTGFTWGVWRCIPLLSVHLRARVHRGVGRSVWASGMLTMGDIDVLHIVQCVHSVCRTFRTMNSCYAVWLVLFNIHKTKTPWPKDDFTDAYVVDLLTSRRIQSHSCT